MAWCRRLGTLVIVASLAFACGTPSVFTVSVYNDANRVIRLQAVPDPNDGLGFSHPVVLSEGQMRRILNGLMVEDRGSALALSLGGSATNDRQPAFSQAEAEFLAPLLVKGLGMATPEEIVTFFDTQNVTSLEQMTTSGGIYAAGDEVHIVFANYRVRTPIEEDERHEAPHHTQPMVPVQSRPLRLVFEPSKYMVPQAEPGFMEKMVHGNILHVAVKYRDLPLSPPDAEPPEVGREANPASPE